MYLLTIGIVAILAALCLTWGVAIKASFSQRVSEAPVA
jgi:hypothetical protein